MTDTNDNQAVIDDEATEATEHQAADEDAYLLPEEVSYIEDSDEESGATDGLPDANTNADTNNRDDGASTVTNSIDGDNANAGDNPPDYVAELASFDERKANIDLRFEANIQAIKELGDKYSDGDISEGEYQAELARLNRDSRNIEYEEQALIAQRSKVETQVNDQQTQAEKQFQDAANSFMARPENAVFVTGSPEIQAFDQQLQIIANSPKNANLTWSELLDLARDTVSTYMDLPVVGSKTGEPQQSQNPQVKSQEIPPHLGQMQSAVPNTVSGKFAHLDSLDGVEFEQALARLSEAEQAQYLGEV